MPRSLRRHHGQRPTTDVRRRPDDLSAPTPALSAGSSPGAATAFRSCSVVRPLLAWAPMPSCRSLVRRSEEHTSELQSLMRISYAVFCLKKKKNTTIHANYID